ncbi:MAG: glycosyltransferase family 2 protein [Rhizobiaceae bacterium]|nr:glycosyltransferase family 2 protein [Rhizobiaceae bacterium]
MRIVALLTVRNEELYLERCVRELRRQGVEVCVIDNDSSDATREIAHGLLGNGVFRVERQQYEGFFELEKQCRFQEHLSSEIAADWFLHTDADEVRQSDQWHRETLADAVAAIDAEGYNAVNFNEFVFVPTVPGEDFSGLDYVRDMRRYYHFMPRPLHRVNLWKKAATSTPDLAGSGGHRVEFPGRNVSPRSLTMRHYIALSEGHAYRKYRDGRRYSPAEISGRGWHVEREKWRNFTFRFPSDSETKIVDNTAPLDTSDPKSRHLFWETAA